MTIRINAVSIVDEVIEKLNNISLENYTGLSFSPEEVYLCKLLSDEGLTIKDIKTSFVFDADLKAIRLILDIQENSTKATCNAPNSANVSLDLSKACIMPLWSEARTWIKSQGFNLDFHYDPFFKEENIKIGFMKPKTSTSDNVIIESDGKTDLEAIYKVILEVMRYQKSNPALETVAADS